MTNDRDKREEAAEAYDSEAQQFAKDFARKLLEVSQPAARVFGDHAIATALLGAGVEHATHYMPKDAVVRWLRDAADAIESHETPPGCAGRA